MYMYMADNIPITSLKKINENLFEIPSSFRKDMRVPALVFTNEKMIEDISQDRSFLQIVNVATLPGIVKAAISMPDIHEGYGFPIGGVAAIAIDQDGVISPGGVGYDINCGIRLLVSDITVYELGELKEKLAEEIFKAVPSGVGRGGKFMLNLLELDKVLIGGAKRMVELGYGSEMDLEYCEENGSMLGADSDKVSERAKNRGKDQIGTLGSGNHFLEIQKVDEVFDYNVAKVFGLHKDIVAIMIHCGSRGLGHQTCTDYVRKILPRLQDFKIELPDKELACAPFNSREGQDYFSAMAASANFAWANRHMIAHLVRKVWEQVVGKSSQLKAVYDVAHNIAKCEVHEVDGQNRQLLVHRKGATRAFGPGRTEIPKKYQEVGQPVLIPGTMGTASYVLLGTSEGMQLAFGSSCHGAGRRMSRSKAKRTVRGSELRKKLERQGIKIYCDSDPGLAEEAPLAYKDVDNVVEVVDRAKIAKKIVRLKPLAVIKGG